MRPTRYKFFLRRNIWSACLLWLLMAWPCAAQPTNPYAAEKAQAYELFGQGKLKQAATKFLEAIAKAPNPGEKLGLARDLLEVCATGYYWDCVGQTITHMVAIIQTDEKFRILLPEVLLYEIKMNRWNKNEAYLKKTIGDGAPFNFINVAAAPALTAELQVELAAFELEKNHVRSAEQRMASAMLGLLLTDPNHVNSIGKIIVQMIDRLLDAQDVVGATTLAQGSYQFFERFITPNSVLRVNHRLMVAQVLSFMNDHALTAKAYMDAIPEIERVEIDEDVKQHQIATANNLAVAALVLANRIDEAKTLHAKHPLQLKKDAIFNQTKWSSTTAFFFGVASIFLDVASATAPDVRWKAVFEKDLDWDLSELQAIEVKSYRNFTLGLLEKAQKGEEAGSAQLVAAALERVTFFEKLSAANSESFPFPSLVDKIVISVGLAASLSMGGPDSADLMLRGGEVLGRSLRQQLVEVASRLAHEHGADARRNVHAYFHLIGRKREWESEKLRQLLTKELPESYKGKIINEYGEAAARLAKLKGRLWDSPREGHGTNSLTIPSIQGALGKHEAFISYFPVIGQGVGKLCVRADSTTHAVSEFRPTIVEDIRSLSSAVSEPPDAEGTVRKFPAGAARRLHNVLFGGLDACLTKGTHLSVALPQEFAGIPIAALLSGHEDQDEEINTWANAPWLIRDFSFSVVISAPHFLATRALLHRENAPRAFLGIGDPAFDATKFGATSAMRTVVDKRRTLLFAELPETAAEIQAVGKLFAARPSDLLLRTNGTEESFRAKPLGEYDVIHFATHGLVKDDIAGLPDSALLLTIGNPDDPFDDGILSATEIARLWLNARLVVLSACNTAQYELGQATRGVQDLQAAFTIAGVPSMLGSLWQVDSRTTQDIVTDFFHKWRAGTGTSAGNALAEAMRDFIAKSDALHQHPYFWGAFLVAGDGMVRGSQGAKGLAPATYEALPEFRSGGGDNQCSAVWRRDADRDDR